MTRMGMDQWRLSIGSVKAGVGLLVMALGEIPWCNCRKVYLMVRNWYAHPWLVDVP